MVRYHLTATQLTRKEFEEAQKKDKYGLCCGKGYDNPPERTFWYTIAGAIDVPEKIRGKLIDALHDVCNKDFPNCPKKVSIHLETEVSSD